jgi:transcriptional regulator with XRE-family HTH domain
MSYATKEITEKLKATREARGMSQRELSELAGVPQSHISKIENGSVDLRVSSLIELSRALGLELTLVPRNTLPAVNTIVRSSEDNSQRAGRSTPAVQRELKRIDQSEMIKPAYSLDENDDG